MNRIVRNLINGKRSYGCEEMAEDPTLLPSIIDAHKQGLIQRPRISSRSKSPATYGTPICVVIIGLTPTGEATSALRALNA
jgi:hypothetical protein